MEGRIRQKERNVCDIPCKAIMVYEQVIKRIANIRFSFVLRYIKKQVGTDRRLCNERGTTKKADGILS